MAILFYHFPPVTKNVIPNLLRSNSGLALFKCGGMKLNTDITMDRLNSDL